MNWIIEHIGWLVALSLLLAFVWSRRTREHRGVKPESRPTIGPRTIEDEAQAERTRRIREEIRRKIAERQALPDPSADSAARGPASVPSQGGGVQPIDPFGGPTRRAKWRITDALKRLRGK
jgi:hypothetical protein